MPVEVIPGDSPLIIALPYTGSNVARMIYDRLNETGRALAGTDHYLDKLIAGLAPQATTLRVNFHRYISDADHATGTTSPARERGTRGVVSLIDDKSDEIWRAPPSVSEANTWRGLYYVPFHAALRAQVARVRARHHHAVLVTAHALPGATAAHAPTFMLATQLGQTDAIKPGAEAMIRLQRCGRYTAMLQGLSLAGGITRRYSESGSGVCAIQLGIREAEYLTTEPEPGLYDADRATPLRERLADVLGYLEGALV